MSARVFQYAANCPDIVDNDKEIARQGRWSGIYSGILLIVSSVRAQLFIESLLLLSIILPDIWIATDVHQSYDIVLNIILIIIFFVFTLLTYVLSIALEGYFGHYIFWGDVFATISIIFEISWFTGTIMPNNPASYNDPIRQKGVRTLYLILQSSHIEKYVRHDNRFSYYRNDVGYDGSPQYVTATVDMSAWLLFNAVETLVIVPLDRMVVLLKHAAEVMLHGYKSSNDVINEDDGDDDMVESPYANSGEDDGLEAMVDRLERLLKQANTEDVLAQQTKEVDNSTKQYIETFSKPRRGSANGGTSNNGLPSSSTSTSVINNLFAARNNAISNKNLNNMTSQQTAQCTPQIKKAKEMGINTWEFHVLDFSTDDVLTAVDSMFQNFHLFSTFNLHIDTLSLFLSILHEKYNANPYHNFLHAVDVCHGCYRILTITNLYQILPPLEILSLLIAALGHDIGHPAVNNAFLVATQHDIALKYNDISPLENMHASLLFDILFRANNGDANLLKTLENPQKIDARKIIITSILSTDMVHHFQLVSKTQVFNEKNGDDMRRFSLRKVDNVLSFGSPETRMFVLEIILHMSDVSNVCKPHVIGGRWSDLIIEEMFQQGDQERERGMPVSSFMDRLTMDKALLQMNFMEFVVAPLAIPLVSAFPKLIEFGNNMLINFDIYAERRKTALQATGRRNSTSTIASQLPTTITDELQVVDDRLKTFHDKLKFLEEVKRVCDDPSLLEYSTLNSNNNNSITSENMKNSRENGSTNRSNSNNESGNNNNTSNNNNRDRDRLTMRRGSQQLKAQALSSMSLRSSIRRPGNVASIIVLSNSLEQKIEEA
eukprot:gene9505-19745_t